MRGNLLRSLAVGVLTANAAAHAYAAAVGATHLTPLAGRDSSARVNALWSAPNIAAALGLLRTVSKDVRLRRAFKAAAAAFTVWVLVSEWVTGFND